MEQAQRPSQAVPQQQASLIRPEQVARLPQLNPQQKQQYEVGVRKFWEVLNNTPQGEAKYNEAYQKLVQLSGQLMQGAKNWQQMSKQRALQQQQAAQQQLQQPPPPQLQQQPPQQPQIAVHHTQQQQPQPPPQQQPQQAAPQSATVSSGSNSSKTIPFTSLYPEIQQTVNEQHFYYPPAMIEGTKPAEDWLREAKARYGQALQRLQLARQKKGEFHRTAQQRQQAGNPLSQQEMDVFNSKVQQCNKLISESQTFMEKFKEQQAQFQRQQPQQQYTKQSIPNAGDNNEQTPASATQGPTQGPTAHSISSAVSAARNQATAQATNATVQPPPTSAHPTPINTNQPPFPTPGQADPPTTSASRPSTSHQNSGGPLPSAMPQSATSTHPLNSGLNGVKPSVPQISKTLQVTEPKPVAMPPSRPTLNGGPGVGMLGQLGQPAITALPGYVLETSEDGRLLSKKKLNELVREVCGPGRDEQLTPEAEEIFLQVVDDFVDDLVSSACKLAKLRGSATLEARDVQLVLERQYNIRIPGFSTDEIRTVRRPQPAAAWAHKVSAVQAAKLTGGGSAGAPISSVAKDS